MGRFLTGIFTFVMTIMLVRCGESAAPESAAPESAVEPGSKLLKEMLAWKFEPSMAPDLLKSHGYQHTAAETRLSAELQRVAKEYSVSICYELKSRDCFLVHLLPLFHVFPAPFCGEAEDPMVKHVVRRLLDHGYARDLMFLFSEKDEFRASYLSQERRILITDQDMFHSYSPGLYVSVMHGVDEDKVFYGEQKLLSPDKMPYPAMSLMFTRFNDMVNSRAKQEFERFYGLDSAKKTILYVGTAPVGDFEFLDPECPVFERVLDDLIELKKKYNIILRTHPGILGSRVDEKVLKNFRIASPVQFPSFVPLYEISDVVIGNISGATTAATSKPELPIVFLRPTISWNKVHKISQAASANKGLVLGEETTILQNEFNVDLVAAVEEALSKKDQKKIEARKMYFKYWFGCIDGHEDYRALISIFEKANVPTSSLKKAYNSLEMHKGMALCHY